MAAVELGACLLLLWHLQFPYANSTGFITEGQHWWQLTDGSDDFMFICFFHELFGVLIFKAFEGTVPLHSMKKKKKKHAWSWIERNFRGLKIASQARCDGACVKCCVWCPHLRGRGRGSHTWDQDGLSWDADLQMQALGCSLVVGLLSSLYERDLRFSPPPTHTHPCYRLCLWPCLSFNWKHVLRFRKKILWKFQ